MIREGKTPLKYLLDTVTISETIKTVPSRKVLAWIGLQADVDLYLSALTIGEICKGIAKAKPNKPDAAMRYQAWLDTLLVAYDARILPFDTPASRLWGVYMAWAPNTRVVDAQIAAIASERGMTVATRNVLDFVPFGVPVFNPFEG